MSRMPVLFVGHGNPMNTLEQNGFTNAWKRFGEQLPRPKALLVVSAHWYFGATAITAMPSPRTIHDFYGFPQKLFDFEYPAPGNTDLAREITELVKPKWIGLDRDQWGLDHGTWSVLAHMYPDADIPVLQLSINSLRPLDYHLDLAASLDPLRDQGVMIIASGNVVHNLQRLQWKQQDLAYDWAERFDDAAVEQLAREPGDILRLQDHPDYDLAVPTPDHFIPLMYVAGLAAADNATLEPLVRGYAMGSVSMTCYGLGTELDGDQNTRSCSASLPEGVPPDQTNM